MSGPVRPSRQEPHLARDVAESFGSDASRYDRARPSYPQAMVERIVGSVVGRDVLDVGCGTGITARQFRMAGCRVLGVDPDERMAEVARQGGLEVEVATFEAWEPRGRLFDAVISGQAWHWVDPVLGAAKVARALLPDGRLALFWNSFEPPPELGDAFAKVYDGVPSGLPFNPWKRPAIDGCLTMALKAADGINRAGCFSEPEDWRFDWDRSYSAEEWLDQVPTSGGHSQIAPDKLEELLAGIRAAVDSTGGSFTMRYTTLVVTAALVRAA